MGRRAAVALHLALSLIGAALYVVFVIPRWWVLLGDFPTTLATVGRIAAGVPIGLAAIPVALLLQQSLKPGHRTPEIALRLRAWSGVLHVVAGVLIVLTAIAEIWLHLESVGPWLFTVYGAAGAIAVLAVLAFYLSFIAEQPAPAPKPAKPAKVKKPRGKSKRTEAEAVVESDAETETETVTADDTVTVVESEVEQAAETADESETDEEKAVPAEDAAAGGLRNKRPMGKSRNRLRR